MYTVPYVKVLRDVDGVLDGHVDRPYVVGGGRRELAVLWLLNHEGLQPRARRPHPSLHRRQRRRRRRRSRRRVPFAFVKDVEDVLFAAFVVLLGRRQGRLELHKPLVYLLPRGLEGLLDLDGHVKDVDLRLGPLLLFAVVPLGADVDEGSLRR